MKNRKYDEAMNQISPDEVTKKRMLGHILTSNNEIAKGSVKELKNKKRNIFMVTGVAAAAVVLTIGLSSLNQKGNGNVLYAKDGVTITAVGEVPEMPSGAGAITMIFSEEEVFSMFDTVAFMGTVKDVKNISIDFDGVKHYRSLATIEVEKVYDGDLSVGETISTMLPGPVDSGNVMGADFNITRAMKPGERGIFMPLVYSSDEVWEENGKVLPMNEFASYLIIDTVRFAFMETEEGILFERGTFPSIKDAKTLEEVEEYIIEKVK